MTSEAADLGDLDVRHDEIPIWEHFISLSIRKKIDELYDAHERLTAELKEPVFNAVTERFPTFYDDEILEL